MKTEFDVHCPPVADFIKGFRQSSANSGRTRTLLYLGDQSCSGLRTTDVVAVKLTDNSMEQRTLWPEFELWNFLSLNFTGR